MKDPCRDNEKKGNHPAIPDPSAGLEDKLGYRFRDPALLEEALTHRSLLNEIQQEGRRDNERLEFLGDAVLGFLVTEWIMELFPDEQEGELTRLRSVLVKEKRLCEVSMELNLGNYLYLGRGEERMEGRRKPSVLANAFESLVGALYLDGGMDCVRDLIRRLFKPFLDWAKDDRRLLADPKSRLQELMLALFRTPPVYKVAEELGPDHAKTFLIQLTVKNLILASGTGRSKKEAEQDAAEKFLKDLEKNPLGML